MQTTDINKLEMFGLQRKRCGLTLKDLAKQTKISIWKFEFYSSGLSNAAKTFSDSEKVKIAKILNTPAELLFDTDPAADVS